MAVPRAWAVPSELAEELERRSAEAEANPAAGRSWAEAEANPAAGRSWDEVREDLKKRLG